MWCLGMLTRLRALGRLRQNTATAEPVTGWNGFQLGLAATQMCGLSTARCIAHKKLIFSIALIANRARQCCVMASSRSSCNLHLLACLGCPRRITNFTEPVPFGNGFQFWLAALQVHCSFTIWPITQQQICLSVPLPTLCTQDTRLHGHHRLGLLRRCFWHTLIFTSLSWLFPCLFCNDRFFLNLLRVCVIATIYQFSFVLFYMVL